MVVLIDVGVPIEMGILIGVGVLIEAGVLIEVSVVVEDFAKKNRISGTQRLGVVFSGCI
jgi:hypothetical protein